MNSQLLMTLQRWYSRFHTANVDNYLQRYRFFINKLKGDKNIHGILLEAIAIEKIDDDKTDAFHLTAAQGDPWTL